MRASSHDARHCSQFLLRSNAYNASRLRGADMAKNVCLWCFVTSVTLAMRCISPNNPGSRRLRSSFGDPSRETQRCLAASWRFRTDEKVSHARGRGRGAWEVSSRPSRSFSRDRQHLAGSRPGTIKSNSPVTSGDDDCIASSRDSSLHGWNEDIPRGTHNGRYDILKKLMMDDNDGGGPLSDAAQRHDRVGTSRNSEMSVDSYWDPQFKGSARAFPRSEQGGSCFTWELTWVPWVAKKHPRGGQPMKSPCFQLGGIDPLQLWFWPKGTALSKVGYCAVKVVSRPGWCLPFPIIIWIKSQYSSHAYGPFHRDSGSAVQKLMNFCRLTSHSSKIRAAQDVRIGPAGNIDIGVQVGDPFWQGDQGAWALEQWLRTQSADPDDEEIEASLPHWYTHSDSYEDRHSSLTPSTFLRGKPIIIKEGQPLYTRFTPRSF